MAKRAKKPAPFAVRLEIEWHYPDDLMSKFANHMIVQHDENEAFLSFFELQPPVLLEESHLARKKLKTAKTIRATCVAKIAISRSRLPGFIEALQKNLSRPVTVDANPSVPEKKEPRDSQKREIRNGKKG